MDRVRAERDKRRARLEERRRTIEAELSKLREEEEIEAAVLADARHKLYAEHLDVLLLLVPDHQGDCTDEDRGRNDHCERCKLIAFKTFDHWEEGTTVDIHLW